MAGHSSKICRILGTALGLACLVSLTSGAALLGIAEWKLRRIHDVPLTPLKAERGPVDDAEGERLSRIIGCWADATA